MHENLFRGISTSKAIIFQNIQIATVGNMEKERKISHISSQISEETVVLLNEVTNEARNYQADSMY